MKAVILVGGFGTRLRPLTINTPKPLFPLVNRPFFDHTLYLLKQHGINDVVLAVAYLPETFEQTYGNGSQYGMKLTYVYETEPLDTGGAIKNVEAHLTPGESFLVFNGDILTDLDLTDMLRYHRKSGSICTISLTPVEDPSQYGVIDMNDAGRIQRFTEKPPRDEATSNWINAGTYIMEPEALAPVPEGTRYSVERGLFPTLLKQGKPLYGYKTAAYWMDIGTPSKYLQAHADLLWRRLKHHMPVEGEEMWDGVWVGEGTMVEEGARITGPVVLGKNCHVAAGAYIIGPTVLGDGCRVADEAEVEGVVAWAGATFEPKSRCRRCIIGQNAHIGAETHVDDIAIVGDNANTGVGNHLSRGMKLSIDVTLPDRSIAY